ncbi:hypothetical protein EDB83DRAFT_2561197 [Lactarius deliciosus]|nr:hypothetical protein EDB83DRAFT_2561197 [Lactarius deliciosus]
MTPGCGGNACTTTPGCLQESGFRDRSGQQHRQESQETTVATESRRCSSVAWFNAASRIDLNSSDSEDGVDVWPGGDEDIVLMTRYRRYPAEMAETEAIDVTKDPNHLPNNVLATLSLPRPDPDGEKVLEKVPSLTAVEKPSGRVVITSSAVREWPHDFGACCHRVNAWLRPYDRSRCVGLLNILHPSRFLSLDEYPKVTTCVASGIMAEDILHVAGTERDRKKVHVGGVPVNRLTKWCATSAFAVVVAVGSTGTGYCHTSESGSPTGIRDKDLAVGTEEK